jgi:hypothetical protein
MIPKDLRPFLFVYCHECSMCYEMHYDRHSQMFYCPECYEDTKWSTRLCLSLRPLQTGQTRASPSPPVVTMASESAAGTRVTSATAALDILGRALETEGLAGLICF